MAKRSAFDARYWNLAQAAAWVVYRERQLVEDLLDSDRDSYRAIGMYPSMAPPDRKRKANLEALRQKLVDGKLTALGRRTDTPDKDEEIPASEWELLHLAPPHVYDARSLAQQFQPWTNVRVKSAVMRKLWRSDQEVQGRTKYPWDELRQIHDEMRQADPDASQRTLIDKIQAEYERRDPSGRRKAPVRSTIQKQMKNWL